MPQITDISPQKKNKDRVNLFLDGKYAFSISLENLLKKKLKIDTNISNDEIAKLTANENLLKLLDRAIIFLSFRPRSEKEIEDYLAKKIAVDSGVSFSQAQNSSLIEKIFVKLKKYNYINDIEFAKWWLASRSTSRPKGINFIKIELLKKGVSRQIIEKVLKGAPNQLKMAEKSIEKKIKTWQKIPVFDQKRKIYNYLASRGFEQEIIEEIFAKYAKKR